MSFKNWVLSWFFICFFSFAFGQKRDSLIATKHRPGIFWFYTGMKPANHVWAPRYDRWMFDVKYNDLVNKDQIKLFNTKAASIGFNTQFIFDIPMNRNNTAAFGIGLGYEFSKFVHNSILAPVSSGHFDFSSSMDKSILRTHTFFVPVELRFRTKGWQHFKFHIGSNVGFRFGNNKEYLNNEVYRVRTNQMDNFEHLYLDAHIRMGIRNIAIIASTNLLPIFKGNDQKIFPVSLGLTISLF